jgi:hypothetical protein
MFLVFLLVSPPPPDQTWYYYFWLIFVMHIEGTIWVAAEDVYNEQVTRVENQIIARFHDRLGTARNANEMSCMFSKTNALLVRPKARGSRIILLVTDAHFDI